MFCRQMLLDPRYLAPELLEVFSNITVDDLPVVLAEHLDNVLSSISRMECYVTGNVDRDRVSFSRTSISFHSHEFCFMTVV